jgi:hypothetical protein
VNLLWVEAKYRIAIGSSHDDIRIGRPEEADAVVGFATVALYSITEDLTLTV